MKRTTTRNFTSCTLHEILLG